MGFGVLYFSTAFGSGFRLELLAPESVYSVLQGLLQSKERLNFSERNFEATQLE